MELHDGCFHNSLAPIGHPILAVSAQDYRVNSAHWVEVEQKEVMEGRQSRGQPIAHSDR